MDVLEVRVSMDPLSTAIEGVDTVVLRSPEKKRLDILMAEIAALEGPSFPVNASLAVVPSVMRAERHMAPTQTTVMPQDEPLRKAKPVSILVGRVKKYSSRRN